MNTPYDILDVSINASDAEIKQAYLRQVKKHPPDHDPDQFRLIHDAYLAVKDKKARLSYQLFTLPTADFDELVNRVLDTDWPPKMSAEQFKALLHASIDGTAIKNIFTDPDNR
jgi:curved DNA-binding protein CbpA